MPKESKNLPQPQFCYLANTIYMIMGLWYTTKLGCSTKVAVWSGNLGFHERDIILLHDNLGMKDRALVRVSISQVLVIAKT